MVLFDLVTRSGLRPSPYCWRAKLALKHKGVAFEARATSFSEISTLGDGTFKTLPVIQDGDLWVGGSWNIADMAESRYRNCPPLFPNDPQRLFAQFVETWVDTELQPQIFPLAAYGIWEQLPGAEQDYFRSTRECRLGTTLEAARDQAITQISQIRGRLNSVRRILKGRRFLAGDEPAYVDYIVFGALKWHALSSTVPLYEMSDPVAAWYLQVDERS